MSCTVATLAFDVSYATASPSPTSSVLSQEVSMALSTDDPPVLSHSLLAQDVGPILEGKLIGSEGYVGSPPSPSYRIEDLHHVCIASFSSRMC